MPNSSSLLLILSGNLFLQAALALSLTLLLHFIKIPALLLSGLFTYVHPDDVAPNNASSNGVRAAIRRPGTNDSELKPRKKSKERFEFDENKAQIFRLKLSDGHLQTRIYFEDFRSVFNSILVSLSCLLLHRFLPKSEESGVLKSGSFVPILFGFLGVGRIFVLIFRVSFERSASKLSEKHLSVLLGFLGFIVSLGTVHGAVPKWVFDVHFEALHGFEKLFIAIFMGCISCFLYMPAVRIAHAFWLGTDQLRCNLPIVSCGWFARLLLHANYLVMVLTSMLWVKPFTDLLLIDKNSRIENVTKLVGNVGMQKSEFSSFRLWCLLVSGLLQIVSLRSNVQMYLNEAVLCWYQRLHASKVPDLAYSRAKVFLHNHFVCLVVLQFFLPASMVLIFLGLSQLGDDLLTNYEGVCSVLPCSLLDKEVALFMAWWVLFVWTIYTSVTLALFRQGILCVS
ncbi:transmembrane protein 161A [Solanum tuberosum]|uniref:Transmembrane protein n=1 Tax=Solanum tuberosum TaxID=4113 RepID=M1B4W7_SOLTU|nr:PREDICTED: transmembrane protein 161A [Solanum tuberosum]